MENSKNASINTQSRPLAHNMFGSKDGWLRDAQIFYTDLSFIFGYQNLTQFCFSELLYMIVQKNS